MSWEAHARLSTDSDVVISHFCLSSIDLIDFGIDQSISSIRFRYPVLTRSFLLDNMYEKWYKYSATLCQVRTTMYKLVRTIYSVFEDQE